MLLHLMLKDLLIIKKYVLLGLLVAIFVPPFLLWRNPELAAALGPIFSSVFGTFMPLMYLGEKENKYTNATQLLAATPYSRKWMVASKYLISLLIFGTCTLIFWVETLLFPSLGHFNGPLEAVLFMMTALFLSIYWPLYYKIGYDNTKYSFVFVIMATPILTGAIDQMPQLRTSILSLMTTLTPPVFFTSLIAVSFILLIISAYLSIRVYNRADLI
ncbi:MAG: ABC-2 transporter permease [Peptococcaceae bacterium]|nr:ABC-2 transporter permease [Peptococcaceae bacterium]